MISIKTAQDINFMKAAGRLTAEVLDIMREAVRPGISTGELDSLAENHIRNNNAIPAFKNYVPCHGFSPFPASICASINEEIVHGIPSEKRFLEEGDIISIDVGVCLNGFSCLRFCKQLLTVSLAACIHCVKNFFKNSF